MGIHLRTITDESGDAVEYSWTCSRSCYLASLQEEPPSSTFEEGGAYPGGAEHDTPDYCAQCGGLVGNPLTEDGRAYVLEHLRSWPRAKVAELLECYGLEAEARAAIYGEMRAEYSYAGAMSAWRWAGDFLDQLKDAASIEADTFEEEGDALVTDLTLEGFSVRVTVRPDYDAEPSGTFTDKEEPGAVMLPDWREYYREMSPAGTPHLGRPDTFKYYVPSITYAEHLQGLREMGYARHLSDCLARQYVREDVARATSEDTDAYWFLAVASREGVELGTDSIGGYDVGSKDWQGVRRELAQGVNDHGLVRAAISEARSKLETLRASVHVVGSGDENRLTG